MNVRLSARARREVLRIDENWRAVADHKDLFADGLAAKLAKLEDAPNLGQIYEAGPQSACSGPDSSARNTSSTTRNVVTISSCSRSGAHFGVANRRSERTVRRQAFPLPSGCRNPASPHGTRRTPTAPPGPSLSSNSAALTAKPAFRILFSKSP